MQVLVLGGYGLIGAEVAARLHYAGIAVTGLTRDTAATRRFAHVRWVKGDLARMTAPEDWLPLLDGIDAVVNCAGALQEGPRDALRAVHVTGPMALYHACAMRGVRRVIHVSAAGIDGVDTAFSRTKREAEAALKATDLDWIVLRPGLVLAGAAYGGTALLRAAAACPLVTPVVAADRTMQVVAAEDVAETVVRALAPGAPRRAVWELMHPAPVTMAEIVTAYRIWLGVPPRPVVRVPMALARIASLFADAAAWFGWRSPLRTTSLKQLAAGVTGNPERWMADTQIVPLSLQQIFARRPASVQERWFARLYLLKPIGIVAVGAFWLFSGVVALGPGFDSAQMLLETGGMSAAPAWWTTLLGGWLDIVLGGAVLFRQLARPTLVAMILACFGYLVSGTLLHPELWLDPLGVYAKVVPIMLAMALLAAIADER